MFVTKTITFMNTSSKYIVAIHIMTMLAVKRIVAGRDQLVKSEFFSRSVNTNPVVIRRIMGLLRKAGLVNSLKGPDGGSHLTRSPELITLLDIYEATEVASVFHLHYSPPNPNCPVGQNIQHSLECTLAEAEAAMKKVLNETQLQSVAEKIIAETGIDKMMESGMSLQEIAQLFENM